MTLDRVFLVVLPAIGAAIAAAAFVASFAVGGAWQTVFAGAAAVGNAAVLYHSLTRQEER